jgi:hypothetical protein
MSIGTARAAVNEAFAGIDCSAVFVVAIVALTDTIRRSTNWIFEPPSASGCSAQASASSRA